MDSNTTPVLLHVSHRSGEPAQAQVVRQLRAKLLRGDLAPDELLPSAARLAREEHVPSPTVAAAYRELAGEGLLVAEAPDTYRVADLPAARRREIAGRDDVAVAGDLANLPSELQLARDVQRRLLPPERSAGPGWRVAARCLPARGIAGDLYAIVPQSDGTVVVVVGDVVGKGLAAGLLMASTVAMLPFVTPGRSPAAVLAELNRRLLAGLGRHHLVAMACARLDPGDGRLELANAGLPDPYRLRPGVHPEPLSAPGPRLPLGVRPEVAYIDRHDRLAPGERLVLLTDGLPEARVAPGEPLGYGAFARLLAETPQELPPDAWLDALLDRLERRTGALHEDDRTALVLERGAREAPCC